MAKLLILLCMMTSTVFAQSVELDSRVLTPSEVVKVIGPYPQPGSEAEKVDFQHILYYQQNRTAKDCELAAADTSTSLDALFGGQHGILNSDEVSRLTIFLAKAYVSSGVNAYIAKGVYKRPRPYLRTAAVKPCIHLEDSYAYPSGHSMLARLYARILSQVYPERTEQFLKRATQYSMNRVIGGVHHPSDIAAAFKLSDYLATEMIENEKFQRALKSL